MSSNTWKKCLQIPIHILLEELMYKTVKDLRKVTIEEICGRTFRDSFWEKLIAVETIEDSSVESARGIPRANFSKHPSKNCRRNFWEN